MRDLPYNDVNFELLKDGKSVYKSNSICFSGLRNRNDFDTIKVTKTAINETIEFREAVLKRFKPFLDIIWDDDSFTIKGITSGNQALLFVTMLRPIYDSLINQAEVDADYNIDLCRSISKAKIGKSPKTALKYVLQAIKDVPIPDYCYSIHWITDNGHGIDPSKDHTPVLAKPKMLGILGAFS